MNLRCLMQRHRLFSLRSRKGFTLIQLCVILTIASLALVAVLPSTLKTSVKPAGDSTARMQAILSALRNYQAANSGRLPCPADPTIAIGASNYGVASPNSGTTYDCYKVSNPPNAAYADTTSHIAIGMVPVLTLGLSRDYAIDSYGRDITYLVDTNATGCQSSSSLTGGITVNDNGVSQNTVAALVSHGRDGYGAWLPLQGTSGTATRLDNGSTDTSQAANAQVQPGGGLNANGNGQFAPLVNQGATSTFDDIVVYKSPLWSLNTLPASVSVSLCPPFYRTITIDHTKVTGALPLPSFPMLFSGTYSYLKTVAHGGEVQNSNGYDITFTDTNGNLLPFERENYNSSTGEIEAWVQVPSVSNASDTVIRIRYDDSSITSDKSTPSGTWDSYYKAVYHLNTSSNTVAPDSTSFAKSLTISGASNVAGYIANGRYFNSNYLYTATTPSVMADNFTLSAWAKVTATPTATNAIVANGMDTDTGGNGYSIILKSVSTHWNWEAHYGGSTTTYDSGVTATTGNSAPWYYLVLVRNNGTGQLYVNGSAAGVPFNTTTTPTAPQTVFALGAGRWSSSGGDNDAGNFHWWLTGDIDEVRVSETPRSASWIAAEYTNQSTPDKANFGNSVGFYSVGNETSVSR